MAWRAGLRMGDFLIEVCTTCNLSFFFYQSREQYVDSELTVAELAKVLTLCSETLGCRFGFFLGKKKKMFKKKYNIKKKKCMY